MKEAARKCSEYSIIDLMNHTRKLILAIINKRIERKIEQHLNEMQFGFRAQRGTRDAIVFFKTVIRRTMEARHKLFVYCVHSEEAFDTVGYQKFKQLLRKCRVNRKKVKFIQKLYW